MSDPILERHIFVCINSRAPGHPKGCCGSKGGMEVRARFAELVAAHGLRGKVRANNAGCLDQCELGAAVVVYPDGVWYKGVRPEDVEEIFEQHILNGKPVERLQISRSDQEWIEECRRAGGIQLPRPLPYEETP